jgi:hypothetical protein
MSKRKLTAAEKAAKRKRSQEFETIFVRGKVKRVRRMPMVEGMDPEEFILRNADPIWLHQNGLWEYLEAPPQIDVLLDMPMKEMTKAQKRHLRDLASIAYERELAGALRNLLGHFTAWQAGKITAWDLNELVHEHHNGISRELYNLYTGPNPAVPVARAIAKGHLDRDEVEEEYRPRLVALAEYFGGEVDANSGAP